MAASPREGRTLAALGSAGCAAALALPISNPDVFWHLSAARWMRENGAVPRADWLSWTRAGSPWVDFEWGAQLVYGAAHRLAGAAGLWAVKTAALGAAAAALDAVLSLHGVDAGWRGVAALAWALAIAPGNDLRPENFSLALLLLLWRVLEGRRLRRGPWRKDGAFAAALACVFAAWANLHAGFALGLLLLAGYAFAGTAPAWALPLAAAAACANPYGPRIFGVLAAHGRDAAALRGRLREWSSPDFWSAWLAPVWALAAACAAAELHRRRARRPGRVPGLAAAAALLAAAGLRQARFLPYFACAGVPLAVLSGERLVGTRGRRAVAAALLAFAAFRVAPELGRAARFDGTPREAADFLDRERGALASLRMLNPWQWGGYLGWRLYPAYRVYWDGRYLFHGMLEPERLAKADPASYARFLDEQGIGLVLLENTGQVIMGRPAYEFFLPSPAWALIYRDARSLVLVRRAAAEGLRS
ncbi:MAG TPA: hypothetical protein VNI01_09220 [Elusimicrobiota bacterium]|jgi:hypothetical protein|nr:hypothetical protein [Elusimicrobiota bacterium]